MKPDEFYDCTYKEAKEFVEYNSLQREEELKNQIFLYEAITDKMISAIKWNKPKYISLIKDTFKDLFKEELKQANEPKQQTIEEQIENLRSWGARNSRPKNKE